MSMYVASETEMSHVVDVKLVGRIERAYEHTNEKNDVLVYLCESHGTTTFNCIRNNCETRLKHEKHTRTFNGFISD